MSTRFRLAVGLAAVGAAALGATVGNGLAGAPTAARSGAAATKAVHAAAETATAAPRAATAPRTVHFATTPAKTSRTLPAFALSSSAKGAHPGSMPGGCTHSGPGSGSKPSKSAPVGS